MEDHLESRDLAHAGSVKPAWDLTGHLDGYAVEFHGEIVAVRPTWTQTVATYNTLRAHAAMARESLRDVLERART